MTTPEQNPGQEQSPSLGQLFVTEMRSVRRQQNMSTRELAERCQAVADELPFAVKARSRGGFAKMEAGITKGVTLDDAILVAAALGIPMEQLVYGTNQTPQAPDEALTARVDSLERQVDEMQQMLGNLSITR